MEDTSFHWWSCHPPAGNEPVTRVSKNAQARKRRLQKMEVKSGSRRKFWEGATKKNNYCNIFFISLFWNWASGISKWYKFEENDIFWGGWGAHFEIYLAENFARKKPACRQFEVFSYPASFLPPFLPSPLPSFHPSFLPSFLPPFLPSFLPSTLLWLFFRFRFRFQHDSGDSSSARN